MNIKQAFAQWMEDEGYGTRGTDIFLGSMPLDGPDSGWWIISGGGTAVGKNSTGEKQKGYIITVYYRSRNAETVDDQLQALEEEINENNCIELTGYDIIEAEATTYPTDQDLDDEDRTVGLVEITLTIYS